jgi:hypothetical protein
MVFAGWASQQAPVRWRWPVSASANASSRPSVHGGSGVARPVATTSWPGFDSSTMGGHFPCAMEAGPWPSAHLAEVRSYQRVRVGPAETLPTEMGVGRADDSDDSGKPVVDSLPCSPTAAQAQPHRARRMRAVSGVRLPPQRPAAVMWWRCPAWATWTFSQRPHPVARSPTYPAGRSSAAAPGPRCEISRVPPGTFHVC